MPSQRQLLHKITKRFDQLGRAFCALLEALEPEDTDAIIRKLRQRAEVAESRLAEAKAEIERLLKLRQWVGREQLNELHADAAVGWLVREMRPDTKLVRGCRGDYLAEQKIEATDGGSLWVWLPVRSPDPAKALRSIQEVDDDNDV